VSSIPSISLFELKPVSLLAFRRSLTPPANKQAGNHPAQYAYGEPYYARPSTNPAMPRAGAGQANGRRPPTIDASPGPDGREDAKEQQEREKACDQSSH
jgi:hypothetical protein